jgi:hypothetical protein
MQMQVITTARRISRRRISQRGTSGADCSRGRGRPQEACETVGVCDLCDNLPNHEEGPSGLGGTTIPLEVDVVLPRPYSGTRVDSEISNLHTGHCDFLLRVFNHL